MLEILYNCLNIRFPAAMFRVYALHTVENTMLVPKSKSFERSLNEIFNNVSYARNVLLDEFLHAVSNGIKLSNIPGGVQCSETLVVNGIHA